MEYKYQKEFPRPFENAVIDIESQDSKALDWRNYSLHKDFKNAVVAKLNDKDVKFNGKFFIGCHMDQDRTITGFDDAIFSQRSTSDNCLLYFVDNSMNIHKIAMVRGWGHLTGTGALNLDPEVAADIQDGFFNWVCDKLNEDCNTDVVTDYKACKPDDPGGGYNAQYDEYFAMKDFIRDSSDKDSMVSHVEEPIPEDNKFRDTIYMPTVQFPNDGEIDDSNNGITWSCASFNESTYTDDPKLTAKRMQTPWYASCLNKKRGKKKR